MRTCFKSIALCWLLIAVGAASAGAQQFTGGVRGAVRDANGVIPGVAVTLTNEATNISREVTTNDVGQFNFPAVPPGTYTLKSQISGYKTLRIQGRDCRHAAVRHDGRRARSRRDFRKRHGHRPVAAHRHVHGIDRRRAGPARRSNRCPRPAATRSSSASPFRPSCRSATRSSTGSRIRPTPRRVSLGGGGMRANNYLLDGVPITELRGRAVLNPTIEAVEEVKVQVHTYDAEMGRTGGGVFNVTAQVRDQQLSRQRLLSDAAGLGAVARTSSMRVAGVTKEESGLADAYYRLLRRRRRRADREEPDVLLGRHSKATDPARRAGSRRSGRRPTSATATSRARRRAARRRCSTTRSAAAASRTPGARQPAPDRSRPAACSPARSSRSTHPAVEPDRPEHSQDVADRDDQRSDGAERGRQHERHRHRVRRRRGRRCSRSRASTSSPTSRR